MHQNGNTRKIFNQDIWSRHLGARNKMPFYCENAIVIHNVCTLLQCNACCDSLITLKFQEFWMTYSVSMVYGIHEVIRDLDFCLNVSVCMCLCVCTCEQEFMTHKTSGKKKINIVSTNWCV